MPRGTVPKFRFEEKESASALQQLLVCCQKAGRQRVIGTLVSITNAVAIGLPLSLLENVGRPHGCEDELLRHLLGELVDGLPAGAVHGHDRISPYLLHLTGRRADDRLENWPREVKSTQNCMDPAFLRGSSGGILR